jgi:hypothetical protein
MTRIGNAWFVDTRAGERAGLPLSPSELRQSPPPQHARQHLGKFSWLYRFPGNPAIPWADTSWYVRSP